MTEELVPYREQGLVSMDGDDIVQIAAQAEARIDAVVKIKRIALKVTNAMDWVDQNGKPYLMASGAEKVANLFNVSWRFLSPEPVKTMDADGVNFTYTYSAEFTMGTRSIQVEGSRSSKDKFFSQYIYGEKDANGKSERKEKDISDRDNERDVKMAAMTNLLGNGITRILGIRNLTYADLADFAGVSQSAIGKVEYKSKGDKPLVAMPQEKKAGAQGEPSAEEVSKVFEGEVEHPKKTGNVISEAQGKRFYAIAKKSGASDEDIKAWLLEQFGLTSTKNITREIYEEVCSRVETELTKM